MRTHSSGWLLGTTTSLLGGISTPTEAQFLREAFNLVDQIPDPARVGRDLIEERIYEHRLQHQQARLQQDLDSGNTARIEHDQRRIQHEQ